MNYSYSYLLLASIQKPGRFVGNKPDCANPIEQKKAELHVLVILRSGKKQYKYSSMSVWQYIVAVVGTAASQQNVPVFKSS